MIDIATERLLNLPDAAKVFPSARAGRPTHPATIWRKIVCGDLEGLYLGTRWVTSLEAIQRYADRQTEAALKKTVPFQHRNAKNLHGKRREVQLAGVDAECEAAGL
ncbi:MAG: hypothetical protein ABSH35_18950 [Isosphaeraceae bacterium]|jgi:hypothetical protein